MSFRLLLMFNNGATSVNDVVNVSSVDEIARRLRSPYPIQFDVAGNPPLIVSGDVQKAIIQEWYSKKAIRNLTITNVGGDQKEQGNMADDTTQTTVEAQPTSETPVSVDTNQSTLDTSAVSTDAPVTEASPLETKVVLTETVGEQVQTTERTFKVTGDPPQYVLTDEKVAFTQPVTVDITPDSTIVVSDVDVSTPETVAASTPTVQVIPDPIPETKKETQVADDTTTSVTPEVVAPGDTPDSVENQVTLVETRMLQKFTSFKDQFLQSEDQIEAVETQILQKQKRYASLLTHIHSALDAKLSNLADFKKEQVGH